MHAQDSTDPTGVRDYDTGRSEAVPARVRKADAAVALRIAAASWEEIAQILGYPTARQALVATERALAKQLAATDSRESMRRMAGARLDRLLRTVWDKAMDPDHPEHLLAATKAREMIADHRRLYGLDAPTEVVVHNPTAREIEAWVASVVTASVPPVIEYDIITGEVLAGAAIEPPIEPEDSSMTDEVG